MNEDAAGDGDGYSGDERTRLRADLDAAEVRTGDRIRFTTDLGKEYEYTVAEVDDTWLTFETGQKVHRDRFDRESFAVVRAADADAAVADGETAASGHGKQTGPEAGEATAPATDGGDLRPPSVD